MDFSSSLRSSASSSGDTLPDDVAQLKVLLVEARSQRDSFRAALAAELHRSAELEMRVAQLEARILELEALVRSREERITLFSRALGDSADSVGRAQADLMIGETASRIDRILLDYAWPGVRSQAHSRIKTTTNLSSIIDDTSSLLPGAAVPRSLVGKYGSAATDFVGSVELRSGVVERWERITAACAGVNGVIGHLKEYRIRHAHPMATLTVPALCEKLRQLGGYGEVIEELEDSALAEAVAVEGSAPPSPASSGDGSGGIPLIAGAP